MSVAAALAEACEYDHPGLTLSPIKTWAENAEGVMRILKEKKTFQFEPGNLVIDADRHAAGSLQRARFSKFDEALSIKLWKTKMPKSFVQEDEAGSLGTTNVLPDLFQVLAMERDEIAEELDVASVARRCRFLAIDPPLDIDAPFVRSFRRRNVSLTYFPFRRTWSLHEPDFSLVIVATRVR